MHVTCTSVGLYLGYLGHRFENTAEDRYKELIKKHKNAPWYPKGQLLAEKYARENRIVEGKFCLLQALQLFRIILVKCIILSLCTLHVIFPFLISHAYFCSSISISISISTVYLYLSICIRIYLYILSLNLK